MPTNFQHCTALVREADRDRYLATLFAPAEHRDALYALYAFNAEIARVRDMAREPMPGEIRLQWWVDVLGGANLQYFTRRKTPCRRGTDRGRVT